MTDKYTLTYDEHHSYHGHGYTLKNHSEVIAIIVTDDDAIIQRIDNALNATSRAGSKTSQRKRDASKANIAKRWRPSAAIIEGSHRSLSEI